VARALPDARPSESYRFALSLVAVLLILTLDFKNMLGRGSMIGGSSERYVIVLVPLVAIFLIRTRTTSTLVRRPVVSDWLLFGLTAYGLIGALWGRFFLGTQSSALPMFLPMVTGLLYLLAVDPMSEREAFVIVRWLAGIGVLYTCLHALASTGKIATIGDLAGNSAYRHPRAFMIALAFVAVLQLRRGLRVALLILLAALSVYIFLAYPAGTYPAVALTAILTLFATQRRASRRRPYVMALIALLVVGVAVLNLSRSVAFVGGYFSEVGKQDNSQTRLDLWQMGIGYVERSPVFGSFFAGEMSVPVKLYGAGQPYFQVPLHNDFLEIAYGGGLVALALFLGWGAATDVTVIRRYQGFVATGQLRRAGLLRALLVAFNCWLAAALFNPLFQEVGLTAALMAIYGLMMVVGEPDWAAAREQSTAAEGAALRAPAPA
jgi:O-antigen ligase